MPNLPTRLAFPPALYVATRLDTAAPGTLARLHLCTPSSLQTRLLPNAPLSLQTRPELLVPSLLRIDSCAPLSLPSFELVTPLCLAARLERFAPRSLPRLARLAATGLPSFKLVAPLSLLTRLGPHPPLSPTSRLRLCLPPSLTRRLHLCVPASLTRRLDITLVPCALTSLEFSPPLNISSALARRLFGLAHECLSPTMLRVPRLKIGLRDVVPAVISQLPWGPWRTSVRDWITMPSAGSARQR
jgi:hypothetical protein